MQLVGRCIKQKEPVLLVGETGCGKTMACQLYSILLERALHVVNCHASTETSDLLGGLRPLRGKDLIVGQIFEDVKELMGMSIAAKGFEFVRKLDPPENLNLSEDGEDMSDTDGNNASKISNVAPLVDFARTLCNTIWDVDEKEETTSENNDKNDKIENNDNDNDNEMLGDNDDDDADVADNDNNNNNINNNNNNKRKRIASFDVTKKAAAASLIKNINKLFSRSSAMFEWLDGPLVTALRSGHLMLLDEMSLAEDAVLERLNSVLEPSRTLVLAEKGGSAEDEAIDEIKANEDFRFFATMNPGGDFGKRELSPALRSRFTGERAKRAALRMTKNNRDELSPAKWLQTAKIHYRTNPLNSFGSLVLLLLD